MRARSLRPTFLALALLAGLLLLAVGPAQAAPGDLDPTFGPFGTVTTAFSRESNSTAAANAVALQSDGKIIAAGGSNAGQSLFDYAYFSLARYQRDGSLDPSFGSGGKVTTYFCCAGGARGMAIQPDGKIVAVGTQGVEGIATLTFVLARYKSNGSLDTRFGGGGPVTTDVGPQSGAHAVVLQPNGKIVAAGFSYDGTQTSFALVRYTAGGLLDRSFGAGGTVTTPIGSRSDANALLLQADGKIVAVGESAQSFALARYKRDGSLDPTFGTGGIVTTRIGQSSGAAGGALGSDGKIVAVGTTSQVSGSDLDFALARYNPDGTLDATFGSSGVVTTDFDSSRDFGTAVALQPSGKIVAVGFASAGPETPTFALIRYEANGSLDTQFGSSGKVADMFGWAKAVTIQPDGKILAAGNSPNQLRLVRYLSGEERCLVPTVKRKILAKAVRAIRLASCSVGRLKRVYSSDVKKRHVISQKPKPGVKRPPGAKVSLVVSKGRRR